MTGPVRVPHRSWAQHADRVLGSEIHEYHVTGAEKGPSATLYVGLSSLLTDSTGIYTIVQGFISGFRQKYAVFRCEVWYFFLRYTVRFSVSVPREFQCQGFGFWVWTAFRRCQ